MTHCLARLDVQPDSPTERRLQQLTSEAFMLAEETFRMRACDNNAKALTLCRWHEHAPIPEHEYVKLLVSHYSHHVTAVIYAQGEKSLGFAGFVSVRLHGSGLHLHMLPVLRMVSCCAYEHLIICFYTLNKSYLVAHQGSARNTERNWSHVACQSQPLLFSALTRLYQSVASPAQAHGKSA